MSPPSAPPTPKMAAQLSPQPTGNGDDGEPSPKNGRKKRRRKGSDERRTQQLHAAKRQHAGKPAMTKAEILLSLPPEIMVCISLALSPLESPTHNRHIRE